MGGRDIPVAMVSAIASAITRTKIPIRKRIGFNVKFPRLWSGGVMRMMKGKWIGVRASVSSGRKEVNIQSGQYGEMLRRLLGIWCVYWE